MYPAKGAQAGVSYKHLQVAEADSNSTASAFEAAAASEALAGKAKIDGV